MAGDFGREMKIQLMMDASVANAVVERNGRSKVRHLEVDVPWLQQEQARIALPLSKVKGDDNRADRTTTHVATSTVERRLNQYGITRERGRAKIAANRCSTGIAGRGGGTEADVEAEANDRSRGRGQTGIWIREHNTWRRTPLSLRLRCRHVPQF